MKRVILFTMGKNKLEWKIDESAKGYYAFNSSIVIDLEGSITKQYHVCQMYTGKDLWSLELKTLGKDGSSWHHDDVYLGTYLKESEAKKLAEKDFRKLRYRNV